MVYNIQVETKKTPDDKWGLYVNDILIGDSKNRFDADFSVVQLKKALTKALSQPLTVCSSADIERFATNE